MTREEVERACEQISEWTKFSSRPIHHTTVHILDNDAKQRAALADKDMEITTLNLALLERDREIERLTVCLRQANLNHEDFERKWYLANDEIERLRKDLDQVVGEAVVFAAQCDSLGRHPTSTIVEKARTFLDSPLVQSWRERQKKETS